MARCAAYRRVLSADAWLALCCGAHFSPHGHVIASRLSCVGHPSTGRADFCDRLVSPRKALRSATVPAERAYARPRSTGAGRAWCREVCRPYLRGSGAWVVARPRADEPVASVLSCRAMLAKCVVGVETHVWRRSMESLAYANGKDLPLFQGSGQWQPGSAGAFQGLMRQALTPAASHVSPAPRAERPDGAPRRSE